jgi:tRNA-uridine 2-sulfurtransferase
MSKPRVLVGMSGGVDSSVAAALLKRRGYDVIGITFQMMPHEEKEVSACCNIHTISDAKRVSATLAIPHYTINIREHFQDKVISPFVNSYLQGVTPNPCVECNRHIKFDELEVKAKELGADFVATGHYCQRIFNPHSGLYQLNKAKDIKKDQTYFLYMLTSEQLSRTLFPLGRLIKPQIRELAHRFGLINANRPESMDICFVTGNSYKQVVEREAVDRLPPHGDVIDTTGRILGRHRGIHTVTIGQRKGLGIAHSEPLYVIKIDPVFNTVTLGKRDDVVTKKIAVTELTLVNPNDNILGRTFDVKTRYNMIPFRATVIEHSGDTIRLHSRLGQSFVTPGQSCVLYFGNRVIGGGIIPKSAPWLVCPPLNYA